MVTTFTNRRSSVRGRIQGPVDYILIDLGTGGLRMGCSNEGDEDCREIGNYPEAQAGTPSLVPQAPSDIIYQPKDDGPAEAVAFGHVRRRINRGQTTVTKVKIALLPDPASYGYAHALLVAASKTLKLNSVQQIPEDFLRLAIGHAIKECSGHPRKGWVFSAPHSYSIDQGRMFRDLIQRAGCTGSVYIQNESDCVAYANLLSIEEIVDEERDTRFKQGRNFSVATAVLDLGAGTADMTISEIFFHVDGTPPTMKELRAPLSFTIGGDLFDERFCDVLRAKLDINLTPDEEQSFFKPFIDHFHKLSKPLWPIYFEDEEYPFHIPEGRERFLLTVDDMTCIMNPPIDEICRRIAEHLYGLELKLIVVSGGNSELPGMMPRVRTMLKEKNIVSNNDQIIHIVGQSSNTIIHGLHYWINHPQLVKGRYARLTLAQVIRRHRSELDRQIQVPEKDVHELKFYDCADRIMSKGDFVRDGVQVVDIYYDLDANAEAFDAQPIVICVPNENAQTYTTGTRIWNFASQCQPVGTVDIVPTLADIKVTDLQRIPKTGRRCCWLRLGVNIGVDVTITVSWKRNGQKIKDDEKHLSSATLVLNNLYLSNQSLVDEFRAPIEKQHSSDGTICHDVLPSHLEKLKVAGKTQEMLPEIIAAATPSCSKDSGVTDVHIPLVIGVADNSTRKRNYSKSGIEQEDSSWPERSSLSAKSFHNASQGGRIPQYKTAAMVPQLPSPYVPLSHTPIAYDPTSSGYLATNFLPDLPFPLRNPYHGNENFYNPTYMAGTHSITYLNDLQLQHIQKAKTPAEGYQQSISSDAQHLPKQSDNSDSEMLQHTRDCYETTGVGTKDILQHDGNGWTCPQVICDFMANIDSVARSASLSPDVISETTTEYSDGWNADDDETLRAGELSSSTVPSEMPTTSLSAQLTEIERTIANWIAKQKAPLEDNAIEERAKYLAEVVGNDQDLSMVSAPGWLVRFKEILGGAGAATENQAG